MPYYWKKGGSLSHWHTTCSHVPTDVDHHPDWTTYEQEPSGKEKCPECRAKDQH